MNKKLYCVICRGMKTGSGFAYVVAENPTEAYTKVRNYLDARDLGFRADRELESVKLLAEDTNYPDCGTILHL